MGDNSYAFAVARIRVREKKLLSDSDIARMAAMKDEAEVLSFLGERGWGDAESAKSAEDMLSAEEEKTWALMKELKIDPAIFEVLEYPKLFHNLKAVPAGFADELSKIAKGVGGTLVVSDKPVKIRSGFILSYGGIEENCSLDAIFAEKAETLRDLANTLLW